MFLQKYIYEIADNALILGQRLGELTGHGAAPEIDIATTNIALDLFGQVRAYYQYAATLSNNKVTEDDIAFLRPEQEYLNVLLVEQPNTDFAYVIARQFLFDQFHFLLLNSLKNSKDDTLAAIAEKSFKEVSYHKRFSNDWLKRLGDGTSESNQRMQQAINDLWGYTDELFYQTDASKEAVKQGIGVDTSAFKDYYYEQIEQALTEATIDIPEIKYFQKGGKQGIHTEHMGYLLAEMQYMQRTYPNMKW